MIDKSLQKYFQDMEKYYRKQAEIDQKKANASLVAIFLVGMVLLGLLFSWC